MPKYRAKLAMHSASSDDDWELSPAQIKELKRRVRDADDPIRYMLVSEFSRRFVLYYNIADDVFAMNEPNRGTLFKRRAAAEKVKTLLSSGVSIVKFSTKGKKLKRLSPIRMNFHGTQEKQKNSKQHFLSCLSSKSLQTISVQVIRGLAPTH